MATYYDDWNGYADVKACYDQLPPEEQVVYAGYSIDGYEGSAIVVFVQDGALWENHDSHCSCYGLERWAPERAEPEALKGYEGWPGLAEAVEAAWPLYAPQPPVDAPRAARLRD